jgi:hypothetical protein
VEVLDDETDDPRLLTETDDREHAGVLEDPLTKRRNRVRREGRLSGPPLLQLAHRGDGLRAVRCPVL